MAEDNTSLFLEFRAGNRVYRVPRRGYYFNNTDCWAQFDGSRARTGLSCLVCHDQREILTFKPPRIGLKVSIFDRLCSFTTKGISLEVNSPVTGTVTSFNHDLLKSPGLVKADPYRAGWVVELDLCDPEGDLEFLTGCSEYYSSLKTRMESVPGRGCPCTRLGRAYRTTGSERQVEHS